MLVDERFLTVHPRTALWWEQRETCRQCAHYVAVASKHPRGTRSTGGQESCRARACPTHQPSCMESREEGPNHCGPEARWFVPAQKAAA